MKTLLHKQFFSGRKFTLILAVGVLVASASIMASVPETTAPSVAAKSVKVEFPQPEKYTDIPSTHHGKQEMMATLRKHFEVLAAQLPAGQNLRVEMKDIVLAGRHEPFIFGSRIVDPDLRVYRGRTDWPRMEFRYTIEAEGKTLQSGTANISDMNYQMGHNKYASNETLRYEKRMLDVRFRDELPK